LSTRINKVNIIIQSAIKHFAQGGFEGARVDEIAEEAKVNKATIYYQIGSKKGVYELVLVHIMNELLQTIENKIELNNSPETSISIFANEIAKTLQRNPDFAPIILREVASNGVHMNEQALKKMHKIRLLLLRILKKGEKQKLFRSCNPFFIHILLIGTLNFYSASASIRDKLAKTTNKKEEDAFVVPITCVADEVVNLILNSIRINR